MILNIGYYEQQLLTQVMTQAYKKMLAMPIFDHSVELHKSS